MAHLTKDRVREQTTTTGTGSLSLEGGETNYRTFATVASDGDTFNYVVVHQSKDEWEVGEGSYDAGNDEVGRNTVTSSSNSGSKVDFSSGTKVVLITIAQDRVIGLDTDPTSNDIPQYDGTQFTTESPGTGINNDLTLDESVLKDGGAKELDVADLAGGLGSADTLPLSDGSAVSWGTAPNAALTNSSVTVAGKSVSLGGSTAVAVEDLSNAALPNATAAGQLLIYDNTAGQFENATLTGGDGVSVTNADASVTLAAVAGDITGSGLTTSGSPADIDVGSGTGITVNANDVELNETVITDGGAKELDVADLAGGLGTSGQVVTTDGSAVSWGTVGSNGIASDAVGNSEIDNSAAFTFNGDLTLGQASQNWLLQGDGGHISLQGQGTDTNAFVQVHSGDADGTEDVQLRVFGVGAPGASDFEQLRVGWDSSDTAFRVRSIAAGTGSARKVIYGASTNSDQIVARTDGNVAMANGLLVGTTGAPSATAGISGGLNVGSTYAGTETPPTDGALFEGGVGFGTTSVSGAATFGGSVKIAPGNGTDSGGGVNFTYQNNVNTTDDATMEIVAGSSGFSRINFAEANAAANGLIRYDGSNSEFEVGTNVNDGELRVYSANFTEALRIDSAQDVTMASKLGIGVTLGTTPSVALALTEANTGIGHPTTDVITGENAGSETWRANASNQFGVGTGATINDLLDVSGTVRAQGGTRSAAPTIGDDSVSSVTPDRTTVLVYVQGAGESGLASLDVSSGSVVNTFNSTANLDFSTGSHGGTTGTDGNVTVAADGTNGEIDIENRTGSSSTFNLMIIG